MNYNTSDNTIIIEVLLECHVIKKCYNENTIDMIIPFVLWAADHNAMI